MPSMRDTALRRRPLTRFMGSKCAAYRSSDGGRKAPSKRGVIGLYGPVTAD